MKKLFLLIVFTLIASFSYAQKINSKLDSIYIEKTTMVAPIPNCYYLLVDSAFKSGIKKLMICAVDDDNNILDVTTYNKNQIKAAYYFMNQFPKHDKERMCYWALENSCKSTPKVTCLSGSVYPQKVKITSYNDYSFKVEGGKSYSWTSAPKRSFLEGTSSSSVYSHINRARTILINHK